jgi:hypothetical protein
MQNLPSSAKFKQLSFLDIPFYCKNVKCNKLIIKCCVKSRPLIRKIERFEIGSQSLNQHLLVLLTQDAILPVGSFGTVQNRTPDQNLPREVERKVPFDFRVQQSTVREFHGEVRHVRLKNLIQSVVRIQNFQLQTVTFCLLLTMFTTYHSLTSSNSRTNTYYKNFLQLFRRSFQNGHRLQLHVRRLVVPLEKHRNFAIPVVKLAQRLLELIHFLRDVFRLSQTVLVVLNRANQEVLFHDGS